MANIKLVFVCGIAVVAVACGVPAPRTLSGHDAAGKVARPGDSTDALVEGTSYRVDSARSEVRLLVYRAGALANLGHNHVIVNRQVSGTAAYTPAITGSAVTLSIPVAAFSVDETQARAQEGADFQGVVPDDAKSGTWRNMLSAALLDVDHHAFIELRSTKIVRAAGGAAATATFEANIAGRTSILNVPMLLDAKPDQIIAAGNFVLKQTDLGLTPFSIMLGAIQVQNEIRVKFTVVAVPGR